MSAVQIATLVQVLVPVALLAAIAFLRQPSMWAFAVGVVVYGLALLFTWIVFPWHLGGVWLRQALPFLFLLAVLVGFVRGRAPRPPARRWAIALNAILLVVIGVVLGGLNWRALKGYQVPEDAVSLSSPLRNGRFVVGHGGGNPLINAHARVQPQDHALDILALNAWGMRARPFGDPAVLENYAIFGTPVYAPCDGRVVSTVDGLPDLTPGERDPKNLPGNHVLIACQGVEVVLAHLRQDSVRVSAGQPVTTQTRLGEVGNSGNTTEPHLHLHAERGGEAGVLLRGEAVPILIEGRYLVRGDRFGEKAQ